MERAFWVGVGGFLGAIFRYWAGSALNRIRPGAVLPYETLVINVAGCLVMGVLIGLSESRGILGTSSRAFLLVGVLGGFTTFSTFGYELFQLIRGGQIGSALASTVLHVVLGASAVWAGDAAARALWGK